MGRSGTQSIVRPASPTSPRPETGLAGRGESRRNQMQQMAETALGDTLNNDAVGVTGIWSRLDRDAAGGKLLNTLTAAEDESERKKSEERMLARVDLIQILYGRTMDPHVLVSRIYNPEIMDIREVYALRARL